MTNTVILLQQNSELAEKLSELLASDNLRLVNVNTGEEALVLMEREKVLLLLIDEKVPDMHYSTLILEMRKISPLTRVSICVEKIDAGRLLNLANDMGVNTIHVAPVSEDEIADAIRQALRSYFEDENRARNNREGISDEIARLDSTIESLKEKLKKQKKSYDKLSHITKCFTDALAENREYDETDAKKYEFVEEVFDTLLRMQTTGTFDIDYFEDRVRSDLEVIKGMATDFRILEFTSCLMSGQSRSHARNIRFSLYLIARYYAQFYNGFSFSVKSHYETIRQTEFIVSVKPDANSYKRTCDLDMEKETALMNSYKGFVESVIAGMTRNYRIVEGKDSNEIRYYMSFPVSGE